jgi:uncharacterized membrane protein YphA (DoxX/SURF4 family)/peroxiredoxin
MMAVLSMIAGLVLAVVFVVSAVGKLMDRAGSRTAMHEFGLPAATAPAAAVLLPFAELSTAALLVFPRTAWWGAIGALVLLVAFIGGIALNMAQGRHPDCHCFGQLHSEPAGWPTIGRNLLLMIPSLLVLFGESLERAFSVRVEEEIAAFRDAGLAVQMSGIWLVGLLALAAYAGVSFREDRRIEARLETLVRTLDARDMPDAPAVASGPHGEVVPRERPVGAMAPQFELPDLDGTMVSLDDVLAGGKAGMLVFADPGCGPCGQLLRELPIWQETHAATLEIVVVSRGEIAANRAKPGMAEMRRVLLQHDRELSFAYGIIGTPSAVLVRADGTIGSPVAGGIQAVRAMLATGGA